MLQLRSTGGGRVTEHDHPAVLLVQERGERLAAQIWMDRKGVGLAVLEHEVAVPVVRVADVPDFAVENDGHLGRDGVDELDRLDERLESFDTCTHVEREVRLEGHYTFVGLLHDPLVERDNGAPETGPIGTDYGRQLREVGIEPDTDEVALIPARMEQLHEIRPAHR